MGNIVSIAVDGKNYFYGAFPTQEEADARAREVWRLYEATGKMPVVVEQVGKVVAECPLAPAE